MAFNEIFPLENYVPNQYLAALLVFVVLSLFLRLFYSVIMKFLFIASKRTETDLDDKILQKISFPVTLLVFMIGFVVSISYIQFSERVSLILNKIIFSASIAIVGYLVYAIVDISLIRIWDKLTKKRNVELSESLTTIVYGITKVILVSLVILYILGVWGIQIGPLLTGLGIAGLAVALALQPTLANIFSGIAIILDKSVRVGDLIYLDPNTKGTIDRIGIRSTKIRTFDNEVLVIPNSKLADSVIQNVALPEPKSRVVVQFSVAYGSDIDKVKRVVLSEIKKINHIEKEPEPIVRFVQMGQYSLDFKAYFYVDTYANRWNAIDEANTRIYNTLRKNKIEIPFPQMDIYIKKFKK